MEGQDRGDVPQDAGPEHDPADREAAVDARRRAYHKGNANHPLPVSEEVGRLIVQDEGGPAVRINLYAEETGRLVGSVLVKRQHTARYALWLLQASQQPSASISTLDSSYPQNLDEKTEEP